MALLRFQVTDIGPGPATVPASDPPDDRRGRQQAALVPNHFKKRGALWGRLWGAEGGPSPGGTDHVTAGRPISISAIPGTDASRI